MFPNNRLVSRLVCAEPRLLNKMPRPVANARTVPVTTSLFLARWPIAPIASPPIVHAAISPNTAETPRSTANVAPGKPMCATAWVANGRSRSRTKYPMAPDASAINVPAISALIMKGVLSSSRPLAASWSLTSVAMNIYSVLVKTQPSADLVTCTGVPYRRVSKPESTTSSTIPNSGVPSIR